MASKVSVHSRARVVCASCTVADSMWSRLRGLMGRKALASGEGLLLRPSGSVHTGFMRFEIDVVFLDRDLEVVGVAPSVRPWRVRARRGARAVLELAGGEAARLEIRPGDAFELRSTATVEHQEDAHALC